MYVCMFFVFIAVNYWMNWNLIFVVLIYVLLRYVLFCFCFVLVIIIIIFAAFLFLFFFFDIIWNFFSFCWFVVFFLYFFLVIVFRLLYNMQLYFFVFFDFFWTASKRQKEKHNIFCLFVVVVVLFVSLIKCSE